MQKTLIAAGTLLVGLSTSAFALQVQIYPAGAIYLQRSNPDHAYVDLVVHNIIIVNDAARAVSIRGVAIDIMSGDKVLERRLVDAEEVRKTTATIFASGQLPTAQLDTDFPWAALRDKKVTIASGARLATHEAAVIKNVFLTVQGMPTQIRVRATAKGSSEIVAETRVAVSQKEPNRYHAPVKGVWYLRSVPNITSHHRWNSQTEFAVDFFKMGENGLPWRTDGRSATDYFGFGEPVFAVADGRVVDAGGGAVQDYNVRLQRTSESDEAYDQRLTQYNLDLIKSGGYRAMVGNFVVIEHPNGEFSSYAHLKTGSVLVKKGDTVKAGQPIAAVGDTGDTNLVHLHFQVSDGADLRLSRSIPFAFDNLFPPGGDLGRVVRTRGE